LECEGAAAPLGGVDRIVRLRRRCDEPHEHVSLFGCVPEDGGRSDPRIAQVLYIMKLRF
jgi:hypothetical protein